MLRMCGELGFTIAESPADPDVRIVRLSIVPRREGTAASQPV